MLADLGLEVFILPLGHDHATVHRMPWVTIGLVVVNLLVFLLTWDNDAKVEELVAQRSQEAMQYWQAHPYLELPPALAEQSGSAVLQQLGFGGPPRDASVDEVEMQQAELDRRLAEVAAAGRRMSHVRFGFVPNAPTLGGALASLFVHAGVFHLVFNLWFLWLAGYNVEDAWGRGLFLGFYLASGLAAAFAHWLSGPSSPVPLVGASGALAGAMGAFMVIRSQAKIRFFALVLIRPTVFKAPAIIMLPMWLVGEIADGYLASGRDGGVAHWAHVGGFVFGGLFAVAMRATGWHARLDPGYVDESDRRRIVAFDNGSPGGHLGVPATAYAGAHETTSPPPAGSEPPTGRWQARDAASHTPTASRRDAASDPSRNGNATGALEVGGTVAVRRGGEALPATIVEIRGGQLRCEMLDGRKVWVLAKDLERFD